MKKEIFIKKLIIKNFKGIKNLEINFSKITDIYGENGIGKTTIFDAFNFLLFDKDSNEKTKFNIQPLDSNNNTIHHLETEIEGIILIDNQKINLRKIYKEKWVKPKGKLKEELRGNETLYYIDDVPQKQNEYKKYISSIVDEKLFKLVTNPLYFASLEWKKRRDILINIAGDIEDLEVINSNKEFKYIEEYLNSGKKIEDITKSIKGKIKRLKEDRSQIPARVDELSNSIEEYDFDIVEKRKMDIDQEINFIDSQILDKSKGSEVLVNKKEEYYSLKNKYNEKLSAAKEELLKNNKYAEIQRKKNSLENIIILNEADINNYEFKLTMTKKDIEENNKKLENLRDKYKKIKNRTLDFNENDFVCPTCKRKFEDADIEKKKKEMKENFNFEKANELKDNKSIGIKLKKETDKLIEEINIQKENIEKCKQNISNINNEISLLENELQAEKNTEKEIDFIGKEDLLNKINALSEEINNFKQEDVSTLKNNKYELQLELKRINEQLTMKDVNAKTRKRIEELEQKEEDLSIQIAQLEKKEILCQEFIKSKINLLENKVNSMFKYVSFRFVKEYNTGGIEEDCEPLVEGVPFNTNLNTAAKLNAGIDIINTLSKHYDVQAPIFIDNRESVNNLIESTSQIINLIVSQDKELRIHNI